MAKLNLNNTAKDTAKEPADRPVYDLDIKVRRAFQGKYGILFDMEVNHVTIYGCRVCDTPKGDNFVGFPQTPDKKDKKKWWNIAYVPLTEEQTAEILSQIANLLNGTTK